MSVDYKWMSSGGILLDGSGDIATTIEGSTESIIDMVRTRLKADLDGWKLYRIGADLNSRIGDLVTEELEIKIRRQVTESLSKDFLPRGAFQVETIPKGSGVTVLVYVGQRLIGRAILQRGQDNKVRVI